MMRAAMISLAGLLSINFSTVHTSSRAIVTKWRPSSVTPKYRADRILDGGADDEARCDIERREQRSRAVPHVIVSRAFGYARHHRQDRLLPIQRLDLAFLINAKDKCPVGRRKVKADDISYLVDEQRIVRQLEGLAAMRLDQCVASAGVVRNVRSITTAT
jgi:hypothetical protein